MKTNRKFLFSSLAFVIFFSCARVPQEIAEEKLLPLTPENVRRSIVRIVSPPGNRVVGSGFFVAPDKIATNIHLVATADPISVHVRGHRITWSIKGVTAYDVKNDLVILKISGEGIPFPIGNSDAVENGESVSAVGYIQFGHRKIMKGVIHSIRDSDRWIRTTVNSANGNSGSPVLNSEAQVIGILADMDSTYSYAIPSNTLKRLLSRPRLTVPLAQWQKKTRIRAFISCELGDQNWRKEKYEEAIGAYDKAIELNPDYADAYRKRGTVKLALDDYEGAIEDYTQCIKLNSGSAWVYYNRGLAQAKLGYSESKKENVEKAQDLYESTIEDCTQVIKLDPEDVDSYLNRGVAKIALGGLQAARGNIEEASRLYDAGIGDYTQAIKLNPEYAAAYNNRALGQSQLGESKAKQGDIAEAQQYYQSAIDDYAQAIELNPTEAYLYNNRAWVKGLFGKSDAATGNIAGARELYEAAIVDSDTAIKLDADLSNAYHTRGAAKAALGDLEGAIADFDRAIEIDPESAENYYERGLAKEALGRNEEARADLIKAKELDPNVGK